MVQSFKNENSWLSNFEPVQIQFEGFIYPSVENAYQSAKNDSIEWKKFCINNEARVVKIKSKSIEVKPTWHVIKQAIMYQCLTQKFIENNKFKDLLLATKDENIQEGNYHGDDYWGINLQVTPNVGENHLGRMIMQIRSKLKIENIKTQSDGRAKR